ncbi:hypothetical protein LCGC14_0290780 [marine sediment metagenome]|uniref:Nucleotidyl transferase domain-containing protein n=1 Tax=marine sediment metagenome TaxID=412755 RepID=A0A0F9TYA5_9ZZZZ|nr:hypothetical protein [archaeon]
MEIKLSLQENKAREKIISIILCAGEGTRINNFINHIPKPLIKINDKPILYYLVSNLIKSNVSSIFIITGHLREQIEKFHSAIMKRKEKHFSNKILLINSNMDYKKGPLYSFLSFTKEKINLKKGFIYCVFPGDTYFESDLIKEVFNIIEHRFSFIQEKSVIFYQNLRGRELKNTENYDNLISTVEFEEKKFVKRVKAIRQRKLDSFNNEEDINQIIPLFVFNYNFIQKIIDLEAKVSVRTIKDIVNHIIKSKNLISAISINPEHRFFDIDTKSDLISV